MDSLHVRTPLEKGVCKKESHLTAYRTPRKRNTPPQNLAD